MLRCLSIGIKAFHHVSKLQMSGVGGDASIAVFPWDLSKSYCTAKLRGWQAAERGGMLGSNCMVWELSPHIGSMGFYCEVYKALRSPTTTASFYGRIPQALRYLWGWQVSTAAEIGLEDACFF